jgi:hypothetical protein
VLKNGVDRYNIFFNFYTKLAESSFLCRFRIESVNVFILPRFDLCHVHISFIKKQFRTCTSTFPNEFTVRSYEYCAGKHWKLYWMQENHSIKQRRISFVLGYLRMILWKISTAISIKHRILATFNIEKKFNSDSLYAFKFIFL